MRKARAYLPTMADDELLITADTIVYAATADGQGVVLGKPRAAEDARKMLRLLSGRTHEVMTGVSILTRAKHRIFSVTSRVSFATLTDAEIDYYIEHYRPFDKAGSLRHTGMDWIHRGERAGRLLFQRDGTARAAAVRRAESVVERAAQRGRRKGCLRFNVFFNIFSHENEGFIWTTNPNLLFLLMKAAGRGNAALARRCFAQQP